MTDTLTETTGTLIHLPPPNTARWVKSRKLAVIEAIDNGVLTNDQACQRYNLSPEELDSWKRLLSQHGPGALRTTHINRYRRSDNGEHISLGHSAE